MGFPVIKGAKGGKPVGAKGYTPGAAKGGFKSVQPTISKGSFAAPKGGGFKGKVVSAAPSYKGAVSPKGGYTPSPKGSFAAPKGAVAAKGTFASAKGGLPKGGFASPKGLYSSPTKGSFASPKGSYTSPVKGSFASAKGGFASPAKGGFASRVAVSKGAAPVKGGFASRVVAASPKGAFASPKGASKGVGFVSKGKGVLGTKAGAFSKGKGKDKGKDKGKGKKGKPAPPADDPFWEKKAADENRQAADDNIYTGIVNGWNDVRGWGFILPDDQASMPEDVQAFLAEESQKAAEKQAAKGKSKGDEAPPALLYFRRPDCAAGYTPEKEQPVTFQLYKDDKGFGACEVQSAN